MDKSKQWTGGSQSPVTQMQFWDCFPKSCITARCFSGSSAWMELWVTMWQILKVQELHSMAARGHSNLRWYLDAFVAFPWFGNRLKQSQMHTLTSSALPSTGTGLKDFLEGLGRDTSPAVTNTKYSLGSTSLRLQEEFQEAKSLDNREHKNCGRIRTRGSKWSVGSSPPTRGTLLKNTL